MGNQEKYIYICWTREKITQEIVNLKQSLMSGWNAEGTKGRCLCSQPDLHTSLYPKFPGH